MPHVQAIIDCDVHNTYRSQVELYPYLREPWLSRLKEKGFGIHWKLFTAVFKPNDWMPNQKMVLQDQITGC